jgi:hypothetical protein
MLLQAPINRQVAIAIFVYEGLLLPLLYSRGNYVLPASWALRLRSSTASWILQPFLRTLRSLLRRTATLLRIRPFGYAPSDTTLRIRCILRPIAAPYLRSGGIASIRRMGGLATQQRSATGWRSIPSPPPVCSAASWLRSFGLLRCFATVESEQRRC